MSVSGQAILAALAAASDPNPDVRHRGEIDLQQLKSQPDLFFSSCAELLVNASVPIRGRQLVGYLLKNNLSHPSCMQNGALQQSVMNHAVVDQERNIRSVACAIISAAVRETNWPVEPVVQSLTGILVARSSESNAVHGAMRALSQIVDDCVQLLDMRQLTGAVIAGVLPYLRTQIPGPDGMEVRLKAFDTVAVVLEQAGVDAHCFSYVSMQQHVLDVIDACFTNLQSPVSNHLSALCVKCMVLSLTYHTLIADELFFRIVELMSLATASESAGSDEELRIEATEFWRGVLCFPRFGQLVEPRVESIIPHLIRSMIYSDMEIGMLQASAADWNVPDKIDDIRPRHYQARVNSTSAENEGNDDGDDDDDDAEVVEWNLRRVSALTLDSIAEYYGEKILYPVLTVIDSMMQPNKSWKELEAAILSLGAISDGCFDSMVPYLPDISTRLLHLLKDPSVHFLVVTISLWTMTQIGQFVVRDPVKLQDFVMCVLQKMESPSKLVQEAATAALQKIVILSDEGQLDGAVKAIIETIAKCMRGYQLKNRVLLFETTETICEVLGEQLRLHPDAIESIMAPLGDIWVNTPDDSPLLFSFFKCMSSLCTALGPAMEPMAKDIFQRSYRLLVTHVQARAHARHTNQDPPEYEFLVTAADLLSGLFDALGPSLERFVAESQPPLTSTVLQTIVDEGAEIRQSGFSLLGDLAKNCPVYVQQVLEHVVKACLENLKVLDERTYGVISNVAWFLSNLLTNQMEINGLPVLDMTHGLPELFASMSHILASGSLTADMRNMAENVCICLGLMLCIYPEVESHPGCSVTLFAKSFCEYMRNVKDVPLKADAVSGFLMTMQHNIPLVVNLIHLFIDLSLSVSSAGPDIKRSMKGLLDEAKAQSGALWQQGLSQFSEQIRSRLYHVYGIQ